MTNKAKIDGFKQATHYAIKHIEEQQEEIKAHENKTQEVIDLFIDFRIDQTEEDERTATRKVYQRVYDEEWKNHIDGKFLTKEESLDWFDDNHDRWFCSGDHIANANWFDLMHWTLSDINAVKEVQ